MVFKAAFLAVLWSLGACGESPETVTEACSSASDDNALLQSRAQVKTAESSESDRGDCSLRDLQESNASVKSFSNFDHGSSYEGLYVNRKAKFAFCLIEKNACSHWTTIAHRIENGDLDSTGAYYGIAQETFSAEDAMAVFNDTSATRAVFIRDPLERFLSAYLDKCTSLGCTNGYCFMRDVDHKDSPIAFSAAVDWLNGKDASNLGDGHWNSQGSHCELSSRLHEYTALGIMGPSTLSDNADCLLERAGLSSVNVQSSTDASSFWEVPSSAKNETETAEYLKSFYTKEAAEAVYNTFKEDYTLFGLPKPSWIGDANGNFFNDPAECDYSTLAQVDEKVALESQSDNSLFDDVPTLARRAGFSI